MRIKKSRYERLVALVMILALTGCATLFGGSSTIPVVTNPPGAFVYVNGQPVGQTPTAIHLDPDRPGNIQIYLPGFQPVQMWRTKRINGWFWVNIALLTGFFIGMLIDGATGKWQKYDDTGIAIGLTPAQGPPPEWYQQPPTYQQPPVYQQPDMPPPPGGITPGQPGNYPPPPPGQ